jgi:hypothetical protein
MTTGREFLVGIGPSRPHSASDRRLGYSTGGFFSRRRDDGQPSAAVSYSKSSKEFYMTSDEIGYIRPGFQITVNSITIPEDRRPVVDYSFTDDLNQPLDRKGEVTPGSLSINQVLAWWDAGTRHYTAYTTRQQTSAPTAPHPGVTATQAAADSGGTWTDVEIGHSIYKFKTVLPESFDRTKTHTLAVYATRNTDDIIGKNYYANLEHDFRPDGQAVTDTWDKTTNAACNNCHNTLSAHGGSRQDIKLCVTCHQPQTTDPDTGNTVDFKVMVHKIHRGEDLPSVQAGTPYCDLGKQQLDSRLFRRRLPAGHPQLRAVSHARGHPVARLVHVPIAGRMRFLPRQRQLRHRGEPPGGPLSRRLAVCELPQARG